MQLRWLGVMVVSACSGGAGKPEADASTLPPSDVSVDVALDAAIDAPVDGWVTIFDAPVDDAPPDALSVCNPLTQAGCSAGEKCTWISDHVGCAPESATPLAIGAACASTPSGDDDCAEGALCLGGACKQICGIQGAAPTCDQNHVCTHYADVLEIGGNAVAGLCETACDPLTQELVIGASTAACGSSDPTSPTMGCYGYDTFACSSIATSTLTLTDRQPPRTNASGNPYLNGCAPGFIPFFYEMTGSSITLCTGFCSALEVDNTPAHSGNEKGSSTALAKLPLEAAPLAGNATCDTMKKGSHASSSCRFIWPYLEDDTGQLPASFAAGPFLDTLGVCIATAFFQYDTDFNGVADSPFPSCTTLPPRSAATPLDFDDAADWGCQRRASPMFTSSGKPSANGLLRVRFGTEGPVPLVRHRLLPQAAIPHG